MKKIYLLFACLTIVTLACGTQMPTVPNTEVKTPLNDVSLPVKVSEAVEPTESAPTYVTTTSLRVRSCASVNCDEVADPLPAETQVLVFVTDIQGKDGDCYLGEWYAIGAPVEGYVCSLYIEER